MPEINFSVTGLPQPGGSKKAFYNPKAKRVVVMDANDKAKGWKALVKAAAIEKGIKPLEGPLFLKVAFYLPRPKSHFNSQGKLRITAPIRPISKPDATKLLRSTEDALTGICWIDDAQIVEQEVYKYYSDTPRAWITVLSIRNDLDDL